MIDHSMEIQEGMPVYSESGQQLGTVERMHGTDFHVAGQHYGRDGVLRVDHNRVYLRGNGLATGRATLADQGAGRIPVAEERLNVETRPAELGAVQVRKTVTEEQQTVPVTLAREEVRVREVNTSDRPLQPGDDAFNEGTLRVPVRGEEAVVAKEAIVTGEVVVDKARTTEQRQVSDTVRKEHVDVDEDYRRARPGFEQEFRTRQAAATDDWSRQRTFEQAEPHYRTGFTAARDARYADRSFEDAEPELRREYEARGMRQAGGVVTVSDRATDTLAGGSDSWERLREDVRSGWNHVRNS
jgi:uncharacterized protein (TIGR02271 family)